ncbi:MULTISPECIES: hypothetical protein [unclassified Sphingomonas]|uniref:hypothetical protein n=1 Tax=unclassified Sphingomonas TaxID=196159 RepID=UPI00226A557C|nr:MULTISPECIES: hypothetical protein [unclassified Sphingomonas]
MEAATDTMFAGMLPPKPADTTIPDPLDGEALAHMAAADFEYFFLPELGPRVTIAVGSTVNACIRRRGDDVWIALPTDMAREQITDAARMFFHLIILGHEIAHLVHRHLYAGQQETEDYRALEYWADFYGAKVMMTLVTFGPRVSQVFKHLSPAGGSFVSAMEDVGAAAGRLIESVYVPNKRYPAPLLRVGLVNNGVTSFLRHEFAGTNIDPIWYFSVYKRIFSAPATRERMIFHREEMEFDMDPVDRARRWHRDMQGDKPAIAPWLKPDVLVYLHTSFDQTDEERAASEQVRLKELQAGGLLFDEPDPEASTADPTGRGD